MARNDRAAVNPIFTARRHKRAMEGGGLFTSERALRVGRIWLCIAIPLLLFILERQTREGWRDGTGAPFGEDFVNFWSGARLAIEGRWPVIYNIAAMHSFENAVVGAEIGLYHYSYPPVARLLTSPFGALPYLVGWLAWQLGGWVSLATALRRVQPDHWLILSLAPPAVFLNASAGQNGCWTAAAIGWGLILLKTRPTLAGAILALFVIKPQLGWLIPIALLAGGQWRALASFGALAAALLAASVMIFGTDAWLAYLAQAQLLKTVILEDGYGTWHRMLSVFVVVRHGGGSVATAYLAQALASLAVTVTVVRCWQCHGAAERPAAILILAMLAGSVYVSDYDLVMAVFAVCWLWPNASSWTRAALTGLIILALVGASLAVASHFAVGSLVLWWPLLISLRNKWDPGASYTRPSITQGGGAAGFGGESAAPSDLKRPFLNSSARRSLIS